MPVIIYRNIQGELKELDIKCLKSFVEQLGLEMHEQVTANTTTISVCQREKTACFTIYRVGSKFELCLDYLRIEPKHTKLAELVDFLITRLNLSGEKHLIDSQKSLDSTYFDEGKVAIKNDHYFDDEFEKHFLREVIFGKVHLALDQLNKAKHSNDAESIKKLKEKINDYKKHLKQMEE